MRTRCWSCRMPARWSAVGRCSRRLRSRVIASSDNGSSAPTPRARRSIRSSVATGPCTASCSIARVRVYRGSRSLLRLPKKRRAGPGSRMADWSCACRRPGASSRAIRARVRQDSMSGSASAACAATAQTAAPWRRPPWKCRPALRHCSASKASSSSRPAQTPAQHHRCPRRLPQHRPLRLPGWHVQNRRSRRYALSPRHCLRPDPSRRQIRLPKTHLRKAHHRPRSRCRPHLKHRLLQPQRHLRRLHQNRPRHPQRQVAPSFRRSSIARRALPPTWPSKTGRHQWCRKRCRQPPRYRRAPAILSLPTIPVVKSRLPAPASGATTHRSPSACSASFAARQSAWLPSAGWCLSCSRYLLWPDDANSWLVRRIRVTSLLFRWTAGADAAASFHVRAARLPTEPPRLHRHRRHHHPCR